MKNDSLKKFASVLATLSLLANSLIAPLTVYSQEETLAQEPTPVVEVTPEPTPEVTPAEELTASPEVTPEQTDEVTPEESETVTPVTTVTSVTPEIQEERESVTSEDSESVTPVTSVTTEEPQISGESTENQPSPTPTAIPVEPEQGNLSAVILNDTLASSVSEFDFEYQEEGSATLVTDKPDYAPTDTVLIYGTDFTPNKDYTLEITSDTGSFKFSDTVTSDESGSLFYSVQLDGTYRPLYKVEAKDRERVIASTTFTDSPPSGCYNDSAGANDLAGQKDLTKLCSDYTGLPVNIAVSWNWDETGWTGNNSGDACSLYDTDGDGFANYALCVVVKNTPATYDSKVLYSCSDTKSDRCTGSSVIAVSGGTSCTASVQAKDPFPAGTNYPNDTVASCTVAMSDVGGASAAFLDVCSYPSQQPNSAPSDCIFASTASQTGLLEVKKVLSPVSDPGLFNLQMDMATFAANVGNGGTTGEKVVAIGNHTVGETAGTGTSLVNYSSAIVCKGNNGTGSTLATATNSGPLTVNVTNNADIVCIISNTLQTGSLVVHKAFTDQHDNSNITITLTPGSLTQTTNASGDATFNGLAAGTYTAHATEPANYYESANTCVNVAVAAGQTANCTITDSPIAPKLTVTKVVVSDNGGTKVVGDFPLFVDGNPVTSGVQNAFSVGAHTVSETGDSGYTETISGDCDSDGNITLGVGDVKSCTITNDDISPKLKLVKTVVNNDGGTAVISDFTLKIDSAIVTSGIFNNINAGIHTASEISLPGYAASVWGGDCNADGTITLALADEKTCTVTNDDIAPTITLIKSVINNNGGQAGPNDFGLTVGGNTVNSGAATPVQANTPIAINETGLNGYRFVSITGDSCPSQLGGTVTLNEGENITCTIINDDQPAHLIVIKNLINDNGGTKDPSDFDITVTGVNASPNSFQGSEQGTLVTLNAGTYDVSEQDPGLGYTVGYSADCSGTISVGENKTCTVTNDDNPATLTVIKHVINDNGGTKVASDFTISVTGNNPSLSNFPGDENGTTITLNAGSYGVDEAYVAGYVKTLSADCQGTVAVGESKRCLISNDDIQPKLTVTKVVTDDNDGTLGIPDFPLFVGQTAVTSGVENGFDAGNYTVSETQQPGYSETISGDCASDGGITLDIGDIRSCTINNDDIQPTLKVVKIVVNDNGGTAQVSDFPLKVNDTSVNSDEINSFDAGTYLVSESSQTGYSSTFSGDCDRDGNVTLSVGDALKTCTISNDDIQPRFTVTKVVINDNGGTEQVGDFPLFVGGTPVTSDQQNGFDADSYIVSETGDSGYTETISGDCDSNGNITLGVGDVKSCTVTNDDQPGSIGGMKFNDENGNGNNDEEPGLEGWHIRLFQNTNGEIGGQVGEDVGTDQNGNFLFENIDAGEYFVCEVQQTGWIQTHPLNGESYNCDKITVLPGDKWTVDFGNEEIKLELVLGKSNDKASGASAGDTVTFALKLTNTSKQEIHNLKITDVLPGGFSYVAGSTVIDGSPAADPTVSGGVLTWDIGTLALGASVTVSYQARIPSDATSGTYTNLATCKGNGYSTLRDTDLGAVECDPVAKSTVAVGSSTSFSGSVAAAVLGAATVLPATGGNTIILLLTLVGLAFGIALKAGGYLLRNKYGKN